MWHNSLQGTLPAAIGNLHQLHSLVAEENQFSGSLPSTLGYLTNLHYLCIENNTLTGPLPLELCKLTNLKELILHNNMLTGLFPSCIYSSLTALKAIDIGTNEFAYHSIPTDIVKLQRLQILFLNDCNLKTIKQNFKAKFSRFKCQLRHWDNSS